MFNVPWPGGEAQAAAKSVVSNVTVGAKSPYKGGQWSGSGYVTWSRTCFVYFAFPAVGDANIEVHIRVCTYLMGLQVDRSPGSLTSYLTVGMWRAQQTPSINGEHDFWRITILHLRFQLLPTLRDPSGSFIAPPTSQHSISLPRRLTSRIPPQIRG